MKYYFSIVIAVSLLLLQQPSCLADEEVEIGNLVLNKTITRMGDEFYEAFSNKWQPPLNTEFSHIKIEEAPSARWGSLVRVSIDGKTYFRSRLSPRSNNIKEIAAMAAQAVMVQLMRETIYKQQQNGYSDLYGTGL